MSDENEYLSEEKVRAIDEKNKKKAKEWLAAAKAEAAHVGKEPFDLDKLINLRKYPPLEKNVRDFRQTMIRELEFQYYSYGKARTLKEFAEFLDEASLLGF